MHEQLVLFEEVSSRSAKRREFPICENTDIGLFSFKREDGKSSVVRRITQRPRKDIDLDKFSQVLRGAANENLIAETRCLYLHLHTHRMGGRQLLKDEVGVNIRKCG